MVDMVLEISNSSSGMVQKPPKPVKEGSIFHWDPYTKQWLEETKETQELTEKQKENRKNLLKGKREWLRGRKTEIVDVETGEVTLKEHGDAIEVEDDPLTTILQAQKQAKDAAAKAKKRYKHVSGIVLIFEQSLFM